MPDVRKHRGAHPEDEALFADPVVTRLRAAVEDLSLLLERGYAERSSLKLVGDRYELRERQRSGVRRSACAASVAARRAERRLDSGRLEGRTLHVDGLNQLVTVEAALAGGVLLRGRDGCLRDLASVHGSYRSVDETRPAIVLVAQTLSELGAGPVHWLLDEPVSNSGRLAQLLREIAAGRGLSWEVLLVADPDPLLAVADGVIATSDAGILDRCGPWLALAGLVVERQLPEARVIDLAAPA